MSDREIVERSGILDLPFNEGDPVMADKGFTISDILPLGVSLNIPPFLGTSTQNAPRRCCENLGDCTTADQCGTGNK